MAVAASFSYKIGGGGFIFLQNWRRWPHFPTKLAAATSFSYKIGGGGKDLATLLAAVLTWSGYWGSHTSCAGLWSTVLTTSCDIVSVISQLGLHHMYLFFISF